MCDQEVKQGFLALVCELAIGIAPFAIILIETAVGLTTDHRIIRQWHSAALTVKRPGRAQKRID